MMLICEDYNENARFTQDTQGKIYFPSSSNNSLWACLLRLQSLGPKELLEDFDVLSKWIDCASWYSPAVNWLPPQILSPVINTMCAQQYQILDHMLRNNFGNDWRKKIWLLFPTSPYLSRSPLMCEAVCEQATLGWFLLPYSPATSSRWAFMLDAPSGYGVC